MNEENLAIAEAATTSELDKLEDLVSLFCFRVGAAVLAVDVSTIGSVVESQPTAPIPRAPPQLKGFAVIGDRAVVVVDVSALFAISRSGDAADRRLIVVKAAGMTAALECDRAFGVIRVRRSIWRPADAFPQALRAVLTGECDTERGAVGVIDLARLLEAARIPGAAR